MKISTRKTFDGAIVLSGFVVAMGLASHSVLADQVKQTQTRTSTKTSTAVENTNVEQRSVKVKKIQVNGPISVKVNGGSHNKATIKIGTDESR